MYFKKSICTYLRFEKLLQKCIHIQRDPKLQWRSYLSTVTLAAYSILKPSLILIQHFRQVVLEFSARPDGTAAHN